MSKIILGQTVHDTAQVKWDNTSKTINKTTQLAAVSSTNMDNRKYVLVYNLSDTITVYAVSNLSDAASTGLPILPSRERIFAFGDAVSVYLLTKSGKADSIIVEGY